MYNLLWIDAITFLIALGLIITVRIPKRVQQEQEAPVTEKVSRLKKFGQDLSVGAKVAKEIPGLAALLSVFLLTNIFISPVNTLSDILVFSIHGGTTNEYVVMSVSFAAGMIVGSIISTLVKEWKHISATLLIGIIGLYVGLFIVGATPTPDTLPGSFLGLRTTFWIIGVGGFITTLGIPIFSTIAVTMIQLSVPIEKMGRFSGFMNALMSTFTPIAYLVSGYLGTVIYIPYVIMGSSVIAIILMILMWIFSGIKKMEPLIKEKLAIVKQQQQQTQAQPENITEVSTE